MTQEQLATSLEGLMVPPPPPLPEESWDGDITGDEYGGETPILTDDEPSFQPVRPRNGRHRLREKTLTETPQLAPEVDHEGDAAMSSAPAQATWPRNGRPRLSTKTLVPTPQLNEVGSIPPIPIVKLDTLSQKQRKQQQKAAAEQQRAAAATASDSNAAIR